MPRSGMRGGGQCAKCGATDGGRVSPDVSGLERLLVARDEPGVALRMPLSGESGSSPLPEVCTA